MTIQLHPSLAKRIIEIWGEEKQSWEAGLHEITGIPVRLSFFFWEVENMLALGHLPDKITIECDFTRGWLPIVYKNNLSYDLKNYITKKIFAYMFSEKIAC